jgi:hypothetical protein
MDGTVTFERLLLGLSVLLNGGLLVSLLYRKNHREVPLFFVYVFFNFLQCFVLFGSYRIWGFGSPLSNRIAWGTQGLVITSRTLAVAEICHRVLGKYRGIWALAWRMLVGTAAVVLFYSWAVARGSWQFAVLNSDRGLELAIASVIVMLFLFTHHYEVAVETAVRTLAIGFFLYSCFLVLNDTVLEGWMYDYSTLWNLLGTLAFLASLLLWNWALSGKLPDTTSEPVMLSNGVYRTLAPEINDRLRALNEHLGQFWNVERKRS